MILTDTGPLVALLDADDLHHALCVDIARRLPAKSLITTWSRFTEAMYLLGEVGGYLSGGIMECTHDRTTTAT